MAEALPQPDMSHLTPEERRIIEGVLMRQKEEEEQDHEIMRYATVDYMLIILHVLCENFASMTYRHVEIFPFFPNFL